MSSPSLAKIKVKICGLSTKETVETCISCGADFLGFVLFPKSPRAVTAKIIQQITPTVPPHIPKVGLFVNPTLKEIEAVLSETSLDMLQLHGQETPEDLKKIKDCFSVPLIKALGVSCAKDLKNAKAYEEHADWLLFDAKPPKGASRPGGNAVSFPWQLMKGFQSERPWMLAGGLTADNIQEALSQSQTTAVDLSSSLEKSLGVKDPQKIKAFFEALRQK